MKFSVIASGSRANCTYLEIGGERLLIDCGLSGKQTEKRLESIGVKAETLTGIVVSHEHRDHIHGVSVMSRRYQLPVYANEDTSRFLERIHRQEIFETGQAFRVGAVSLSPFRIVHDAVDPVGFVIEADEFRFLHVTDLGRVTPLVRSAARDCDVAVVESNHDPDLLRECGYPWELKQRIQSSHGHLSNQQAVELILDCHTPHLEVVVLAHLSENSNHPDVALETIRSQVSSEQVSEIHCAGPTAPTPLLEIEPRSERFQLQSSYGAVA